MRGLEDANLRARVYPACQYARKHSSLRGKRQSHVGCYCNSTAVEWIHQTLSLINQQNNTPEDGERRAGFQVNDV